MVSVVSALLFVLYCFSFLFETLHLCVVLVCGQSRGCKIFNVGSQVKRLVTPYLIYNVRSWRILKRQIRWLIRE